jgi:hypothetical protein
MSDQIEKRHDQSQLHEGPTDPNVRFPSQSAEKPPIDDVDKEP